MDDEEEVEEDQNGGQHHAEEVVVVLHKVLVQEAGQVQHGAVLQGAEH